jgi:hypothetical protein
MMHTLRRLRQGIALVCCSPHAPTGRLPAGRRKTTGKRVDSGVTPTGTLRLSWEPLFPLGDIFITPRALRALKTAAQHPLEFLAVHASWDWGEQGVLERYWNGRAMHVGSGRTIATDATTRGEVLD